MDCTKLIGNYESCPYCYCLLEGKETHCYGCRKILWSESVKEYFCNLEKLINSDDIFNLYRQNKLSRAEWLCLTTIEDEGKFLRQFLTGMGEYKLYYDTSISQDLYPTNTHEVLQAFYSLYKKYPDLEFDKYLYLGLFSLSYEKYNIYKFLTIIEQQLIFEKEGESPFHIECLPLLEICRPILKDNIDYYSKLKLYRGQEKPNGEMDIIREYNETFKKILGYDILV